VQRVEVREGGEGFAGVVRVAFIAGVDMDTMVVFVVRVADVSVVICEHWLLLL
jgi:type IV secretory pathway VirB3-like protein